MSNQIRVSQFETTKEAVDFIETLLSVSADGIVVTDIAQNIIIANSAFCKLIGGRDQEIIESCIYNWLDQFDDGSIEQWAELEKCIYNRYLLFRYEIL